MRLFKRRKQRDYTDPVFRIEALEAAFDTLIAEPRYDPAEQKSFNGQVHRKAIFKELVATFPFEAIIETGTFLGNTTGYMSTVSGLPVHTCEINKYFHHVASARLAHLPLVKTYKADSAEFVRQVARTDLPSKFTFVYLDAHWQDALPLQTEIEVLLTHWKRIVIMIDDFKVPGDKIYGYDNYGGDKVLSLEKFGGLFSRHGLRSFFPSLPCSEETGVRRGCVVLVPAGPLADRAAALGTLKPHP
jgi:predicted O-methyltransferase YrrM